MCDSHMRRFRAAGVVVIRRKEIEALRLDAERLIGETAFANEHDLRAAAEGVDD